MSFFRFTLAAASALLFATAADAASISYGTPGSPIGFSLRRTNFDTNISVPKFDTALGTLESVSFALTGDVVATIQFENRSATPATLTGLAKATLSLYRPDLTALVVALPQQTAVRNATAYDTRTDFAGTSGFSLVGLSGTAQKNSDPLTSAADLQLFSSAGGGSILLPVGARGNSAVTSAGNFTSVFTTQAAADFTVTYIYSEAAPPPVVEPPVEEPPVGVPTPVSLALLGSALLGLSLIRRQG